MSRCLDSSTCPRPVALPFFQWERALSVILNVTKKQGFAFSAWKGKPSAWGKREFLSFTPRHYGPYVFPLTELSYLHPQFLKLSPHLPSRSRHIREIIFEGFAEVPLCSKTSKPPPFLRILSLRNKNPHKEYDLVYLFFYIISKTKKMLS